MPFKASAQHPHDLTPDLTYALDALVRVVERQARDTAGDFHASILLISADGKRVLDAAGPHLPLEYRQAINGLEIGPAAGSCGTAAYLNERVIVADIATDPLWDRYRQFALPHGLLACWSQPIRSSAGAVLGTFAMYYDEPKAPTEPELQIIEAAARRAGAMLEQARGGADRVELLVGLGAAADIG